MALEGDAKAMHNYALIQYNKMDYDLAYEWFQKAADAGLKASANNIEKMHKEGKIKKNISRSRIDTKYRQKLWTYC